MNQEGFSLGRFLIEPSRNALICGDNETRVEPRLMALICRLSRDPGQVVSRETLIDEVWGKEFGGDESLTQAVSSLRKAFRSLDDDAPDPIETIPKRGYRIIEDIGPFAAPPPLQSTTPATPLPPLAGKTMRLPIAFIATASAGIVVAAVYFMARGQEDPESIESASEVVTVDNPALETVAPEGVGLAVIPFVNLSSDEEQEYFVDGLSEELLNRLANIEGLRVPGRSSAFFYKGKNENTRQIGEQLNVKYILDGSVRKAGTALRINTQLVEAETGYHIWSATFDRELGDIFAIQDDIARSVSLSILGVVSTIDPGTIGVNSAVNAKAQEQFLIGRAMWNERNAPDAHKRFKRAMELDANHALAHAYFAVTTAFGVGNALNFVSDDINAFDNGQSALARAVELRPDLADVRFAQGYFAELAFGEPVPADKRDEARRHYQRAINADPKHVEARYAFWRLSDPSRVSLSAVEETLAILEEILAIDPLLYPARYTYIEMFTANGNWQSVFKLIDESIEIDTRYGMLGYQLAQWAGDIELSGDYLLRHWAQHPKYYSDPLNRANLLAQLGALDEAIFLLSRQGRQDVHSASAQYSARILADDPVGALKAANDLQEASSAPRFVSILVAIAELDNGQPDKALQTILESRSDLAGFLKNAGNFEWRADDGLGLDWGVMTAGLALEALNRNSEAQRIWLSALKQKGNVTIPASPWRDHFYEALFRAKLGEHDKATAALQTAKANGFSFLYPLRISNSYIYDGSIAESKFFENLHRDPRFEAIIDGIRTENDAVLKRLNEKYGVLDDVRAMMAIESQD